jgi:hypothetical protein
VCGRWQFLLFLVLWFDWRNLLLESVNLIKFFSGELQKAFLLWFMGGLEFGD